MNKNYNIIVTGGSGFIGTNLVEYLIDKKYKVVNIDKCSYSSVPEKFKFYKKDRNYKFIKANLTNEKKIEKIFKLYKPRFIFNLAAESHVDRSIDYPKKFLKSNINSSISLLEVLRKFKQKKILKKTTLIHLSTDEVYGSNLQKPSNENDLLKPNSPYSSSKASVDNILRAYLKTYKMPIIIVRCCNNFGPYQFPEKFIPTIVLNLLNNKRVPIYGSGKNIREWIYVKDHCSALEKIMQKGKSGNIFNVGSGKLVNNKNLAFDILNQIKSIQSIKTLKKPIKFVKDRPAHDLRYSISSKKLKKLKWKIEYRFDLAIKNTINWYLKNDLWVQNCKKIYYGQRLGLKNK